MKEKNVTRRDFLRLSGLATAGVIITACGQAAPPAAEQPEAAATTAPAAETEQETAAEEPTATSAPAEAAAPETSGGVKDVSREKTLVMMWGGTEGQFTTVGLANPYNPGNQPPHRQIHGAFEPL